MLVEFCLFVFMLIYESWSILHCCIVYHFAAFFPIWLFCYWSTSSVIKAVREGGEVWKVIPYLSNNYFIQRRFTSHLSTDGNLFQRFLACTDVVLCFVCHLGPGIIYRWLLVCISTVWAVNEAFVPRTGVSLFSQLSESRVFPRCKTT